MVFADADADANLDAGEAFAVTGSTGNASLTGLQTVQQLGVTYSTDCKDLLSEENAHVSLYSLFGEGERVVSAITSFAMELMVSRGKTEAEASGIACSAGPCVPCAMSTQGCAARGCAESCSPGGKATSIFQMGYYSEVELQPTELAWKAGITFQVCVEDAVRRASFVFQCVSAQLCGIQCSNVCNDAAQTLNATDVHRIAYQELASLAEARVSAGQWVDFRDAGMVNSYLSALSERFNTVEVGRAEAEAMVALRCSLMYSNLLEALPA